MNRFLRGVAASLTLSLLISVGVSAQQTYPLSGSPAFTYWVPPNLWSNKYANFGDTPFAKALDKNTGVKITYLHPSANQVKENLNLLAASGELPDMVEYNWFGWPGGPEKAMKDGLIVRLNDAFKKWAPNLTAYLKAHPDVDRMMKTDNGDYYAFPFIRGDQELMVFQGPMLRQDWLDELKLSVPTTIGEWTKVLKAFKDKKGASAPLSIKSLWTPADFGNYNLPAFVGAYGIVKDFYIDGGKVQYGPAQPGFKGFVELMHQWYADGLLDNDIALVDGKLLDSKIISGQTGATVGYTGSVMGYYAALMKDKDPKFKLVAAPYPVLKKGDKPKFGQLDLPYSLSAQVAISAKVKNLEAAVRFLDYGYSKEGERFYNFGTEGVSYTLVKGVPTYTDLIMNNPDKLSVAEAMFHNIRGNSQGPFIQDKGYIEQYLALPEQKKAIVVWQTDMAKYIVPRITPSLEESSEFSKIMNDVNTYVAESFIRFVLGATPLTEFPKFQDHLKKLKIDRALAIQQAALDRYSKR